MSDELAGRSYAQVYRVSRRTDVHDYLRSTVERAGGEVLFMSPANRAPVYLGIQGPNDERIGVLCYPFRCNPPPIRGRAPDEHRLQIRYGGEASWFESEHHVGLDIAGVDTTIVVGVHLEADLLIGLDPLRYDPLPMGISIEFRQSQVDEAQRSGWHVWERETRGGRRRESRAIAGLETLIAFSPERFLAYIERAQIGRRPWARRLRRRENHAGLSRSCRLRRRAARATAPPICGASLASSGVRAVSGLTPRWASAPLRSRQPTRSFLASEGGTSSKRSSTLRAPRSLSSSQGGLAVAVRGGVAEHHLARHLRPGPEGRRRASDRPGWRAGLRRRARRRPACSGRVQERGAAQVRRRLAEGRGPETRSQRDDPAGRFYRPAQFGVVAACLYAVTGDWEFRFKATAQMARHESHPDRLAVMHRVDDTWAPTLDDALA